MVLVANPNDTVKVSARIPRHLAMWIEARSNGKPSAGIREALEELHAIRTAHRIRKATGDADGPRQLTPRDMARELLQDGPAPCRETERWFAVTKRLGKVEIVETQLERRGWARGSMLRNRAEAVVDALDAMHAARRL